MFSLLLMVLFFECISLIQSEFYLIVSSFDAFLRCLPPPPPPPPSSLPSSGSPKEMTWIIIFFLNNWLGSCPISFVLIFKYHNILSFKFKQGRTKLYMVTVSNLPFFDLTTEVCSISVVLINTAPGKIVIKEGIYCIFYLLFIWSRMLFGFI